jgi:hypothetical protein
MALEQEVNPLSQFMYSLKALETRRQWPQRLKMSFDFLKIERALDHQAKSFANKARKDLQWGQESFIRFISLQNERVCCLVLRNSLV